MEALILFALVLGLLFIGLPVGVALGLSSILFITFFSTDSSVVCSDFAVWCGYSLHPSSNSVLHHRVVIYVDGRCCETFD